RSAAVGADEKKCLSGVVRVRTWLAHELSSCNEHGAVRLASRMMTFDGYPLTRRAIQIREWICVGLMLVLATACGPHAHIPLRPTNLPGALAPFDKGTLLARRLAPVLYLQKDETFPLERVVAVLHPQRPIIAYHLLWRDDVHGSWIPFTVPTDEEIVWVGFDSTSNPIDLWTFWHGTLLHSTWRDRGTVAVNVQWGKHGSLARGAIESDLPRVKKLNDFYA